MLEYVLGQRRRLSQFFHARRRGLPESARRRLIVEMLESREAPAIDISGHVFQTLEIAGLYPQPSGDFLAPLQGINISLDGGAPTQTAADGSYSFAAVPDGTHTITVELPAGMLATSSTQYTINVSPSSTNYTNLNFALIDKTDALVSNIYELVLSRSADLDGFTQQVTKLQNGGKVGGVFNSIYNSEEFSTLSLPVARFVAATFSGVLDIGQFRHAVQYQNLGVSQDAAILDILYSQQFIDQYGDTSLLSNNAYVKFLYQELLNRNPTAKQRTRWVSRLDSGEADRGDVAIALVTSNEFEKKRANVDRRIEVSLAYLGVLGQEATPNQLKKRVTQLKNGVKLRTIVNQLAKSAAFQNLTAYTDSFVWDARAHQIKPAVNLLNRLAKYNPVTQEFDLPVTPGSITSSGAIPTATNAYFIAHGWAPGFTEDVLLNSVPGSPTKWWQTSDSVWLEQGVNQISAEGMAQAILDRDPNAQVFAFSWIDQSNTPAASTITTVTLDGDLTLGSPTVTGLDTSSLVVGMAVSGPGIPQEAMILSIDSPTSITLNAAALGNVNDAPLTFSAPNLTIVQETATLDGTTAVTGVDTSKLSVGMEVAGPGVPIGTTIAAITSSTSLTLSQAAAAGTVTLTFKGVDLAQALSEFIYASQSASYTQLNGLRLAAAIEQALSNTFAADFGLIHILGHSHGSKVATVAALALQTAGLPIAHLTTLESPEAGPVLNLSGINVYSHLSAFGGAQNFLWYYMNQMEISRSPVADRVWNGSTFIDNYFSNQGFGVPLGEVNASNFGGLNELSEIADFKFYAEHLYGQLSVSNPFGAIDTLFGSHGYPPPWYAQAGLSTTEWGLNLSPLIDETAAGGLTPLVTYQQSSSSTSPGQYVIDQFNLETSTRGILEPTAPVALEYAQQYQVGMVSDDGSTIELSVSAGSDLAMDVITFNPINIASLDLGAGMDFQVEFSGLQPGEQVELQIWIHGLAGVPVLNGVLAPTMGALSVPLFTMNGADAGSTAQNATISLGGFFSVSDFGNTLTGPFNAVNNGDAATIVPTIGFTLVGNVSGTVTATVSNMRQFNDGATLAPA